MFINMSTYSADMNLWKCGRKSAYFFTEKQNRKKMGKNGRKQILRKFTFRFKQIERKDLSKYIDLG